MFEEEELYLSIKPCQQYFQEFQSTKMKTIYRYAL